jgi:hypothetical protein
LFSLKASRFYVMISKIYVYENFLRKHWLALVFAVMIGLIYVGPHIAFIISLEDQYRGIPMMQTPNEISYLARIQEILDGHPMLGSLFLRI